MTASGTPHNGSYYTGVSSDQELLPVEDTTFRGSFLKINVRSTAPADCSCVVVCMLVVLMIPALRWDCTSTLLSMS